MSPNGNFEDQSGGVGRLRNVANVKNETPEEKKLREDMVALMPSLKAVAMRLCKNSHKAEDLAQETFLRAWNAIKTRDDAFEFGSNLRAWMFTILRNTYFRDVRHNKRMVAVSQETFSDLLENLRSPSGQESHSDMVDFRSALAQIPSNQREALILMTAGFTHEEVARFAGCAVGTVKSRVNRAREKLSEILDIRHPSEFGSIHNTINAGKRKGAK